MVRRLSSVLGAVVLVTSGTYLLVYLYRWEWKRATVAGVFFVAAEVAVAGTAVLRRLRSIEARLDQLAHPPPPGPTSSTPGQAPDPLATLRATAPERPSPFAWLEPDRTNVFVPVLLGAGVLLSVLAAVVERVAGATAVPALERRLAHRLAPLGLPDGLLAPAGAAPVGLGSLTAPPPVPIRARLPGLLARAFAAVVAVFALVVALDVVAQHTKTVGEPRRNEVVSELTLDVAHRRGGSAVKTSEGLWAACRATAARGSQLRGLSEAGPDRATMVISPALGEHARRRFTGCLQDATFDRVTAEVLAIEERPLADLRP